MPSCLNILLILKQKSKLRNLKMKSRKDLSNSTMGKMSIKKPLFRESRGATHMVVMHRRELSALPNTYELAPRSQAKGHAAYNPECHTSGHAGRYLCGNVDRSSLRRVLLRGR